MRHWRSRRGWTQSDRAHELDRRTAAQRRLYAIVVLLIASLAAVWLLER